MSGRSEGSSAPLVSSKGEADVEMNGHVCSLQNGDIGHTLKEAKDLLSEARKSTRFSTAGKRTWVRFPQKESANLANCASVRQWWVFVLNPVFFFDFKRLSDTEIRLKSLST